MDLASPRHTLTAHPGQGRIARLAEIGQRAITGIDFVSPILDLGLRVVVASVFFQSGLTKIASWSTTLALFESEYAVPLLSPATAAYLGTAAELGLPVLLVFGLGTRAAAIALFVFNAIAAISYPDLSEAGRQQHQYWGLLMLVTLFHGPGRLSLDHLIGKRFLAGVKP